MNCPHCKKEIPLSRSEIATLFSSTPKPSERIKTAARENGKKGGRPRKNGSGK